MAEITDVAEKDEKKKGKRVMKCDRCGESIHPGDEMDHFGQTLSEDCTVQALSPSRGWDPWAVGNAQTLSQMKESYSDLSEIQTKFLQLLEETGGVEPTILAETLQVNPPELERELATLCQMEKILGKMKAGKKPYIPRSGYETNTICSLLCKCKFDHSKYNKKEKENDYYN